MKQQEHWEQVVFVRNAKCWLPEQLKDLIFAIPNGGVRHIGTANKLKQEGVVAGVPDIFFEHSRLGYHGLRIEMKKKDGGYASDSQRKMLANLNKAGYYAIVCHGADEAMQVLRTYMIGQSMPTPEEKFFRWNKSKKSIDNKE